MGLLEGLPSKVPANFSLVKSSEGQPHNRRLQVYLKTTASTDACVQATTTDHSTDALIRLIKGRTAAKPAPSAADPAMKRAGSGEGAGPSKKPRPPSAATGSAPAGTTPEAGGSSGGARQTFTAEDLKAKTGKELAEMLKARLLPVSGNKDVLIRRILDCQRNQKAHPHFQ